MMKKTKLVIISYFYIFFNSNYLFYIWQQRLEENFLTYIFVTHDYYRLNTLTIDIQNRNFSGVSEKA